MAEGEWWRASDGGLVARASGGGRVERASDGGRVVEGE